MEISSENHNYNLDFIAFFLIFMKMNIVGFWLEDFSFIS